MTLAIYQQTPHLLHEQLTESQIRNLLAPVGFADWQAAHRCLERLATHSPELRLALAESLPQLLITLADAPNPNRVLVNFERFVKRAADPTKLLRYLTTNPRGFEILFTLFTGSQFLTEILLRHPPYFANLVDHKRLSQPKNRAQLAKTGRAILAPFMNQAPGTDPTPAMDALRRFQRQELLRIGTCDLLGLLDLPTVTSQLSYLADTLVQLCLEYAGYLTGTDPADFAVIGMGKLGGEELNYSSDIDLLFLAKAEANRYRQLGQQLIEALDRVTGEGFLYRVDMRLRPWGRSGALVYSVEAHLAYLANHADLWEQQALLKGRVIAGNRLVGQAFLDGARPLIFDTSGEAVRAKISNLKQRIEKELRRNGRIWGEIKLGQGSIRDIEFVTQYLQLLRGNGQQPSRHTPNTLNALANLTAAERLTVDEHRVLRDGYIFLRTVEHHLQLMHYRQTHSLPNDQAALAHLAHRLGFTGPDAGTKFTARYQQHSAVIRAVYQRHLGSNDNPDQSASPDVLPLLTRMPASYVTVFSQADIEHHAELIENLGDDRLVQMEAVPVENGLWQVTIVGYDYLGELSLICGLLFVYGFNIVDGHVFTYGPSPESGAESTKNNSRRKIVDVFTVLPVAAHQNSEAEGGPLWDNYKADLTNLFERLQSGDQPEVQGELAKRVAVALPEAPQAPTLYPVDIDIDNEESERHTVLRIEALDTVGFLYEFTNALALTGINIRRMTVASAGNRVQDTLYVTDAQKQKITSAEKQRELRVATALIKHFTHLLPRSPNPEAALLNFRHFIGQLFRRPDWPSEIASLTRPQVLSSLARLLGVSDFLWNDFLRMQHENLFPLVKDVEGLAQAKSKRELREELAIALQPSQGGAAKQAILNEFKDREMFRIDMRQIEGHISEFGQFSAELSDLAEVVIEAAYQLAAKELRSTFGLPRLHNGQECPLSLCGLGKCGGRELGFASDIELMFIYAGSGKTSGPRVTTTTEFYIKLVREVNQIIQSKREGIFELDLRLRPYGNAGSLAISQDSFHQYFGPEGDAWPYERQALVKLRPLGGNLKFGQELVRLRDQLIYTGEPFDVAAMRAMRERQLRHLVTAGTINAKFSPGGLVDVEYLVQGLQISHGHHDPSLRHPNTREAMRALAAAQIIPEKDYPRLRQAHRFLRQLINALRMVRGNAKDLTVPATEDEAFAFLARRLNYGHNLAQLEEDLKRHTRNVQELSGRLLG